MGLRQVGHSIKKLQGKAAEGKRLIRQVGNDGDILFFKRLYRFFVNNIKPPLVFFHVFENFRVKRLQISFLNRDIRVVNDPAKAADMVVMAMGRQDKIKHDLALRIDSRLFNIIQHNLLIANRAVLAAVVVGGIARVDQGEMAVALQQNGVGIAGV